MKGDYQESKSIKNKSLNKSSISLIEIVLSDHLASLSHPDSLPADVSTLLIYLHTHLFDSELTVKTALSACGLTSARIHGRFRRYLGYTIRSYIEHRRIEAARRLLHLDTVRLADVALTVGYENYATFRQAVMRRTGKTPSAWKEIDGRNGLPHCNPAWLYWFIKSTPAPASPSNAGNPFPERHGYVIRPSHQLTP